MSLQHLTRFRSSGDVPNVERRKKRKRMGDGNRIVYNVILQVIKDGGKK